MASVRLTDDEWLLLRDEPADLLKVYVELRRRMDFANATVGQHERLSEQAIKEVLHVPARAGRRAETPTRKRVRYVLSSLERLGAIEAVGSFVFRLPYAPSDDSVQKRWGQGGAKVGPEVGPNETGSKSPQDNSLNGQEQRGGHIGSSEVDSRWGLPPGAGPGGSSPDGEEVGGGPPPCPQQEIIDLYREICVPAGMSDVRVWNKTRQGLLRARWRQASKHQSLEFWRRYFEHCANSKFLTGQADPQPGKPPFVADLEWIVKPNNFAKIVEGKYHRG